MGEPSPREGGSAPASPRAGKQPGFPPRPAPLAPLQPQRGAGQEGAGGLPTVERRWLPGLGMDRTGLRELPERGSKASRFQAGWWRGLSKQGTRVPRCQAERARKSQTQLGQCLGQPPRLCQLLTVPAKGARSTPRGQLYWTLPSASCELTRFILTTTLQSSYNSGNKSQGDSLRGPRSQSWGVREPRFVP